MASASVDHMLSLTIFIAALLLFIAMFSNTIQTGLSYQQHTAMSTKTSDLLDTLLLSSGLPINWSRSDLVPVGLGLQDPEFGQYKINSLASMRLANDQNQTYYPRTDGYYSNFSAGYGGYLLTPNTKTLNYTTAAKQLGVNGTYGFQLTLTPTVSVSIQKISTGSPLQFSISASGTGFVLSNANITYSLIVVNQDSNEYPSYNIISGETATNAAGTATTKVFSGINGENRAYALIVYARIYGLKGVGYYVHVPDQSAKSVVPLVESFQNQNITLAHSDSVGSVPQSPAYSQLSYNTSYAIVTEEYTLRQVSLQQSTGKVTYNSAESPYASVAIPDNAGILVVTYKNAASSQYGVVLMPWGLGSLGFPLTFGGNSAGYSWVTTDIRQVTIDGVAYQATLSLWSLQGGS
ncbi:MAG: hypothetical protein NWE96_11630 [Candidatus Bathyarchaeota archaeon]|nr:hypothetical protein [Candidatus Bathyarchaeota archaeon]